MKISKACFELMGNALLSKAASLNPPPIGAPTPRNTTLSEDLQKIGQRSSALAEACNLLLTLEVEGVVPGVD